jgi:hypothetical protein
LPHILNIELEKSATSSFNGYGHEHGHSFGKQWTYILKETPQSLLSIAKKLGKEQSNRIKTFR